MVNNAFNCKLSRKYKYSSKIIDNSSIPTLKTIWTASSEFGTYRICEQRRFRRACASAQSRQNLRCSLIQAVSQEEPSGRKPDPKPLWMAWHAQLKFVMTECSKTQIRLTGLILSMLWLMHVTTWSSAAFVYCINWAEFCRTLYSKNLLIVMSNSL